MMPSDPMAQCSNAPPAKVLYRPSIPPPLCALWLKKLVSASPFKPGIRIQVIKRQIASTPSVNKIRDFSSGILKQLVNVLAMERNMRQTCVQALAGLAGLAAFAGAPGFAGATALEPTTSHAPPLASILVRA